MTKLNDKIIYFICILTASLEMSFCILFQLLLVAKKFIVLLSTYWQAYIYIYIYICVCKYKYMRIYIYIYTYVRAYICIHIKDIFFFAHTDSYIVLWWLMYCTNHRVSLIVLLVMRSLLMGLRLSRDYSRLD